MPLITVAQKNCEGTVIDKVSGNKIPYATVGLVRENKGVSADEQGAFNIRCSFPDTDSLRVSSVGYKTILLPVSKWVNGTVVQLEQQASQLGEVLVSSNRQQQFYTLNRFGHCSSNWYQIGLEAIHQLAQRFYAPEQGMRLTELELCKDPLASVFRIRIYDLDPVCQCPSKDLADTVIEIRSKEKHVQIDLEQYGIVIPGKSFFVAVEWLFIPVNEETIKQKRNGRKTEWTYYKPALRFMHNRNPKQGSVFVLGFNGKWFQNEKSSEDHNFQIMVKLR